MPSSTITVRVNATVKRRLEKLARSTRRSRSSLTAEALTEYLATNEWQVTGIEQAATSLEQGRSVAHEGVRKWVDSWGSKKERPAPRPRKA